MWNGNSNIRKKKQSEIESLFEFDLWLSEKYINQVGFNFDFSIIGPALIAICNKSYWTIFQNTDIKTKSKLFVIAYIIFIMISGATGPRGHTGATGTQGYTGATGKLNCS